MRKTLLLSFLIIAISIKAFSQIQRPDGQRISIKAIDSIANKLLDTAQLNGLEIGIVNFNNISYVKSYGFKNRAKSQLNDTNSCFYAASLAKPLFAYMVMQLVDEGKIDLDKPLYTYLPKPLPEYDNY